MAKFEMRMPEEFLLKLSKLNEKTDYIFPKVLEAGGEVVLDQVKANLKGVIAKNTKYKSRSTGELVSSLGLSPALIDRKGNYNVKVGFSEPRSDGDSNAKIANVLEYGKSNQQAKPFLKPARSKSRKACLLAMEERLKEEVKKL